jgi:hypothetical protein
MDEAQLQYEKKDSITLKRNAKGEYAWDIKLYYDGGKLQVVVGELKHTDAMLREAFLSG